MSIILDFIKNYGYALILGIAFGHAGWGFKDWELHIYMILIITLVSL